MSGRTCQTCTQWWHSRPIQHAEGEECPTKRSIEERMAKKKRGTVAAVVDLIEELKEDRRKTRRKLLDLEETLAEVEARAGRQIARQEARREKLRKQGVMR
jgi:hypothetical protein